MLNHIHILDPENLSQVSTAQRKECTEALLEEAPQGLNPSATDLQIEVSSLGVAVTLTDAAQRTLSEHVFVPSSLETAFEEYRTAIVRLEQSEDEGNTRRTQIFDEAKKVIHNSHATMLQNTLKDFELSHEMARRLFTLLFSMLASSDT